MFHFKAALDTLGFDVEANLGRDILNDEEGLNPLNQPVTLTAKLAHPYKP